MNKIDVNCMFGSWPFRKMVHNKFEDLQKIHITNSITSGYISSLQSVFYNDPMEAEEDMHAGINGTDYLQIFGVNPTLPAFEDTIAEAAERFHIAGVRIYPGYHGFTLDDLCIKKLHSVLSRYKLPLYITARLEDERLNYILTPRPIPSDELRDFVYRTEDIPILISNLMTWEVTGLKDLINGQPNLYVDTSYLRDPTGCIEHVLNFISDSKLMYGSGYPLYCLQSSLIQVERAQISEESKEKILYKNALNFFSKQA